SLQPPLSHQPSPFSPSLHKYFFCTKSVKFIPLEQTCNGKNDCAGGEDEITCLDKEKNDSTSSSFLPPVRLRSNKNVLQVYSPDSVWRSVCYDDWTEGHTQTACKQLGYTIVCKTGSVVSLSCSDCGEAVVEGRIIGGTDASIEHWPWQVSLRRAGQHTCGGSLVSPRWVVTAAHCFSGSELSQWRVVSGQTYVTSLGGSYVDRIIVHAGYDPVTNDYDIALMRLSSPITVGDTRRPVCLPPKDYGLTDGASMHVTGWGYQRENGVVSDRLQEASVPLIVQSTCSSSTVYGSAITQRMLCAGFPEGAVDACQGDSGGPLVHFNANKWHLVGVVSWGDGCARKGKPGVYSNVEEMLNWVQTAIEVLNAGYGSPISFERKSHHNTMFAI
uniref:Transmembrane serine protease 4a n=1 Tax=Amphilophus citrinellus TaxID=61819 RepID=A0A3Q0QRL0_AMPCI